MWFDQLSIQQVFASGFITVQTTKLHTSRNKSTMYTYCLLKSKINHRSGTQGAESKK